MVIDETDESPWRPISEWDQKAEAERQHTSFPVAFVTDGSRVVVGEDWGEPDDDGGWRMALDAHHDGPCALDFVPTHFVSPPDPPIDSGIVVTSIPVADWRKLYTAEAE